MALDVAVFMAVMPSPIASVTSFIVDSFRTSSAVPIASCSSCFTASVTLYVPSSICVNSPVALAMLAVNSAPFVQSPKAVAVFSSRITDAAAISSSGVFSL